MVNLGYVAAAALLDSLSRLGVRHAVITPGSRNSPLALAAGREPTLQDWVIHDERSAAFFALGIGATSGSPAVVITTSGTAAAELFPAVVEADAALVPLIAVTADRPPHLRGTGAPQTIDQVELFGRRARLFIEVSATEAGARTAALRAYSAAVDPPAGPVHLNFPFAEPLIPDGDEQLSPATPIHRGSRAVLDQPALDELAATLSGKRCLLVVGPSHDPDLPDAALGLAGALRAPVVADPASGARRGARGVVTTAAVLAAGGFFARHPADVIVRMGLYPSSKAVFTAVVGSSATQIGVWPGGWADPDGVVTRVVRADAAWTCAALTKLVEPGPEEWWDDWTHMEESMRHALDQAVAELPFPSEPGIAAAVAGAAPAGTLWAASSMPIRLLETAAGSTRARIRASRGANGIDGIISTALGAAAAEMSTALLGDVAALHDLNALLTMSRTGLDLVAVVIHNDGGGIFNLLPQADLPEFERLFGTPHGVSFTAVADAVGLEAVGPRTRDELAEAVAARPGPRLVEVTVDRARLAADLREVEQRALRAAGL